MIIDLLILLVFLTSIWIGWSMRIYLDWLRILWIVLFSFSIYSLLPYFISFIEHSSAELPRMVYYSIGIGVALLIFLGLYLLIQQNHKASSGVRRIVGSLVFVIVTAYSLIVLLSTMGSYGWIDISQSLVFLEIPDWLLTPLR